MKYEILVQVVPLIAGAPAITGYVNQETLTSSKGETEEDLQKDLEILQLKLSGGKYDSFLIYTREDSSLLSDYNHNTKVLNRPKSIAVSNKILINSAITTQLIIHTENL